MYRTIGTNPHAYERYEEKITVLISSFKPLRNIMIKIVMVNSESKDECTLLVFTKYDDVLD